MPLEATVALEPQLAAHPLDRTTLPDEPDTALSLARGPREEHRDQPLAILEAQGRRVLDVVAVVTQPAGPRIHGRRKPRDVEQLVDEMGPVVQQHAAPPRGARSAPRRGVGRPGKPGVGREPVDRELGEVPAPDRAVLQPLLHLHPHRIEAVLMARHHDSAAGPSRDGEAVRFRARDRHGFFTHHMVALPEAPQREVEVRRRRRANVDEVERAESSQLVSVRQQRDPVHRREGGRAVHDGDDLDSLAHPGGREQRGEMRLARDAARPDDGATVPRHVR